MTADQILKELKALGTDPIRNVLMKHGGADPIYGVRIEDMKKLLKRHKIKIDHQLALDLYDSGVYDAMYLAGLIADDHAMTKKDLEKWAAAAYCYPIAEYTVAWVAAEGRFGLEMALKWIDSKKELVAAAGWSTLGCLVSLTPDDDLDMALLRKLLDRVAKTVHGQPNRARYTMNGFVISVGCYVPALTAEARKTAAKMGAVEVDMGGTSCKVPDVAGYIKKVEDRGTLGRKRKTVKC